MVTCDSIHFIETCDSMYSLILLTVCTPGDLWQSVLMVTCDSAIALCIVSVCMHGNLWPHTLTVCVHGDLWHFVNCDSMPSRWPVTVQSNGDLWQYALMVICDTVHSWWLATVCTCGDIWLHTHGDVWQYVTICICSERSQYAFMVTGDSAFFTVLPHGKGMPSAPSSYIPHSNIILILC